VLDGRVAAACASVQALDYRQNEQSVTSFELDRVTGEVCVRAAEVLGLRFSGIDLKTASDGRTCILEANPSPMFLGFDQAGGTDLLGMLSDALISHAR
jgi:glutathione synthase/RimK-type ligase-like ATP-grasp enzyme